MAAKISGTLEKILEVLPNSQVKGKDIVKESEQSFLDYSLSVITSRALPDLRDGLKPVHRRILYSAYEEKMFNDSRFKKSAALVGAVMGSYHPHGDSSIYGALVRLSQDFSMRYPLLEGQGNFGSIDGDGPAAMRYTEVKMSKMGEMFLEGIKEDCVDFVSNYDGSKQEPKVLPVVVPSILLNGGEGIAVGMASKIPPHNLKELCDAAIKLLDNPSLSFDQLTETLQGPDFPTGGIVIRSSKQKNKYVKDYLREGTGSFVIRAECEIIPSEKQIIIKSIPFGVKKSQLIKRIAERASEEKVTKNKKIKGHGIAVLQRFIKNIRDESNLKEGIRLVIECEKKNIKEDDLRVVLRNLYKYTPLQKPYAANLTLLNEGKPEIWGIGQILRKYLDHQIHMLIKRTQFNLQKLEDRIHLLEGRKVIVEDLIKVVKIITEEDEPEEIMRTTYSLSDKQLKDIFDLPLRQLKRIEFKKLVDELEEKYKSRKEHKELLESEVIQKEKIKSRLSEIKEIFKDDQRRTKIMSKELANFRKEDLLISEMLVVVISDKQYISAFPLQASKEFKTSGNRGEELGALSGGDKIADLFIASSRDDILLFSESGMVYKLKGYQIKVQQDKGWSKKPIFLKNLISFKNNDNSKIVKTLTMTEKEYSEVVSPRRLSKDEKLQFAWATKTFRYSAIFWLLVSWGCLKKKENLSVNSLQEDNLWFLLVTEKGYIKKLHSKHLRIINKNGKSIIRLSEGDKLKFVIKMKSDSEVLIATANGNAVRFRTELGEKREKEIEKDLVLFEKQSPDKINDILKSNEEELKKLSLLKNYELLQDLEDDSKKKAVVSSSRFVYHQSKEFESMHRNLSSKLQEIKDELKKEKSSDNTKIDSAFKFLKDKKVKELQEIENIFSQWISLSEKDKSKKLKVISDSEYFSKVLNKNEESAISRWEKIVRFLKHSQILREFEEEARELKNSSENYLEVLRDSQEGELEDIEQLLISNQSPTEVEVSQKDIEQLEIKRNLFNSLKETSLDEITKEIKFLTILKALKELESYSKTQLDNLKSKQTSLNKKLRSLTTEKLKKGKKEQKIEKISSRIEQLEKQSLEELKNKLESSKSHLNS